MNYKLQNRRSESFATNSSSSHMVVSPPVDRGSPPDPRTLENEFGWDGEDVDHFWGKVMYALVQYCSSERAADSCRDDFTVLEAFPELKGVVEEWLNAAREGHVDHQSASGDIFFWEMVARNDNAIIKILNDNG